MIILFPSKSLPIIFYSYFYIYLFFLVRSNAYLVLLINLLYKHLYRLLFCQIFNRGLYSPTLMNYLLQANMHILHMFSRIGKTIIFIQYHFYRDIVLRNSGIQNLSRRGRAPHLMRVVDIFLDVLKGWPPFSLLSAWFRGTWVFWRGMMRLVAITHPRIMISNMPWIPTLYRGIMMMRAILRGTWWTLRHDTFSNIVLPRLFKVMLLLASAGSDLLWWYQGLWCY